MLKRVALGATFTHEKAPGKEASKAIRTGQHKKPGV
jgi:hypothetical protein